LFHNIKIVKRKNPITTQLTNERYKKIYFVGHLLLMFFKTIVHSFFAHLLKISAYTHDLIKFLKNRETASVTLIGKKTGNPDWVTR